MDQIPIAIPRTKFELTFDGMYGAQLVAAMINATYDLFFFGHTYVLEISISHSVYGAAMTMVAQYFKSHSNSDTLVVKGMIVLLVALATLETVCASHQTYEYFVLKFGRKDLLDVITVAAMGKYVGIYLTAFVAQL
ncbi:hypothetical protein BDQ17DRAFT_1431580 [Cyathus striatus]|nr:hypothetical protein BDQ17DRAFT_1431580 [Cyathus striatus]